MNKLMNSFSLYIQLLLLATLLLGFCGSKVIHFGKCTLIINEACNSDYVKLYLFSRVNPDTPQYVYFDESYDNLTQSNFLPNLPNKLIIHGFNADMYLEPLIRIKTEYLKSKEVNVWMVDWSKIASTCYLMSIYNTLHVGHCLAEFITRLQTKSTNLEELHIIGFSLGSHVPGSAASFLQPYIIPRVTGLDPARPFVELLSSQHQLSRASGRYVDVIHTNCLMQGQVGSSGHADFYMNGGFLQPGCSAQSNPLNCDHHRAPEYYAESIGSTTGFWGWKCPSIISYILGYCPQKGEAYLMGEHIKNTTLGEFIVKTASESPYALGKWEQDKINEDSSRSYNSTEED